jgi:hypothetical protein
VGHVTLIVAIPHVVRHRYKWEDNIKVNRKEIVDMWTDLASSAYAPTGSILDQSIVSIVTIVTKIPARKLY